MKAEIWPKLCHKFFFVLMFSCLVEKKIYADPIGTEWVIEGSGDAPDLSQLPEVLLPKTPLVSASDFRGMSQRSPVQMLLNDAMDLEGGAGLQPEAWQLSVDGYVTSQPMSLP